MSEEGARLAIDLPEDAVLADGEERSAAAGVDQDLLEALVEVERLALADTAAHASAGARPSARRLANRPARPDSLQNPGQVSSADGP